MCKLKVNDIKEPKTAKVHGGMIRPTYLAILKENAARSRMKLFDYLVNCGMYLHENEVEVKKEECFSDNDNRQTFIKKKVREYIASRQEFFKLQEECKELYVTLDSMSFDQTDSFHATCTDGNIDELHYSISDCEASLRNHELSGKGLLQDISNLISNKLIWPLEEAGSDTSFLLMCTEGTLPVPLKIVNGEIWMGSLPSKSVVYLNGKKKVI